MSRKIRRPRKTRKNKIPMVTIEVTLPTRNAAAFAADCLARAITVPPLQPGSIGVSSTKLDVLVGSITYVDIDLLAQKHGGSIRLIPKPRPPVGSLAIRPLR